MIHKTLGNSVKVRYYRIAEIEKLIADLNQFAPDTVSKFRKAESCAS